MLITDASILVQIKGSSINPTKMTRRTFQSYYFWYHLSNDCTNVHDGIKKLTFCWSCYSTLDANGI